MESLTHPSIGEISKAFLETVWKYLLLLIILQKSFFFSVKKLKIRMSGLSPNTACLYLSPVVSIKNKKP